jgi:predicted DNA binding CopG/RHH family protein
MGMQDKKHVCRPGALGDPQVTSNKKIKKNFPKREFLLTLIPMASHKQNEHLLPVRVSTNIHSDLKKEAKELGIPLQTYISNIISLRQSLELDKERAIPLPREKSDFKFIDLCLNFKDFNAQIPTYVVTAAQPGILGAAVMLQHYLHGAGDVIS